MGYKIFASYKYADDDVKPLGYGYKSTVRGYVDRFEAELQRRTDFTEGERFIYKGEDDGHDMKGYAKSTIERLLNEQMFDSSVTVLFISPNMRSSRPQEDQWIPREIRYSVRKETRDKGGSLENAVVAVILPDKNGSYDYYNHMNDPGVCRQFNIVQKNIDNGYIEVTRWDFFIHDFVMYIERAIERKNRHIDDLYKQII